MPFQIIYQCIPEHRLSGWKFLLFSVVVIHIGNNRFIFPRKFELKFFLILRRFDCRSLDDGLRLNFVQKIYHAVNDLPSPDSDWLKRFGTGLFCRAWTKDTKAGLDPSELKQINFAKYCFFILTRFTSHSRTGQD